MKRNHLFLLLAALALGGCDNHHTRQVSNSGAIADEPHMALDGRGHGVGIWTEERRALYVPTQFAGEIVVARYDANSGFEPPFTLYAENVNTSPRIGMHGDGSARAAWRTETGSEAVPRWKVVGASMAVSGVWTVEPFAESAEHPKAISLATNRDGDAILAWWQGDDVLVSFASPGQGWADPIVVGSQEAGSSYSPTLAVAINPDGDAVLVRTDRLLGKTRVVAQHFRTGFDPLLVEPIDDGFSCELGDYNELKVSAAIDADGFVVASWVTAGTNDVGPAAANRFDPATGWAGVTWLSAPGAYGNAAFVECDLSGAAVASWTDDREMKRATFTPANGWETPVSLGPDRYARSLSVAPNGCAITVGVERSTGIGVELIADVMPPSSGWSGATRVTGGGEAPDVAMEESGLAVALSLVERRDPFELGDDTVVVAHVWRSPRIEFEPPPAATPNVPAPIDASKTTPRSTDAGIVLCEWDYESDGVVDETYHDVTGLKVAHSFPAVGVYEVELHVADSWGYTATETLQIVVSDGGDGPPWHLLVQESGGTGRVVSSDDDGDGIPEIDCPTDCEDFYADGRYVFLRATPDPGFLFDHWEGLITDGDMDYGGGECTVFMHMHRTITAVFVAGG